MNIKEVNDAWENFEGIKNLSLYQAYPIINFWDDELRPLYIELHVKWDENKAKIFMEKLNDVIKSIKLLLDD